MFKKNIFYTLILFFFLTSAWCENNIAYLDLEKIINESNIGKNLLKKLKEDEDKTIEFFSTKEKKLKEEENKILASKNIISSEAFNLQIKQFKEKIKNYRVEKSNKIENLKKERNRAINELIVNINPIISEYMNNNAISIIIDKKNIFIANKNYDITKIIIDKINLSMK